MRLVVCLGLAGVVFAAFGVEGLAPRDELCAGSTSGAWLVAFQAGDQPKKGSGGGGTGAAGGIGLALVNPAIQPATGAASFELSLLALFFEIALRVVDVLCVLAPAPRGLRVGDGLDSASLVKGFQEAIETWDDLIAEARNLGAIGDHARVAAMSVRNRSERVMHMRALLLRLSCQFVEAEGSRMHGTVSHPFPFRRAQSRSAPWNSNVSSSNKGKKWVRKRAKRLYPTLSWDCVARIFDLSLRRTIHTVTLTVKTAVSRAIRR